jgi:hypothetical protein
MSKRLFKEEQTYQSTDVLFTIGLIAAMLVWNAIHHLSIGATRNLWVALASIAIALGLGAWMWYLTRTRLATKITTKKITTRMNALRPQKVQIPIADIASCEVVETSLAAQWTGGNISFEHEQVLSVNGRNGLAIETHDGRRFFLGSSNVEALKQAVQRALREA